MNSSNLRCGKRMDVWQDTELKNKCLMDYYNGLWVLRHDACQLSCLTTYDPSTSYELWTSLLQSRQIVHEELTFSRVCFSKKREEQEEDHFSIFAVLANPLPTSFPKPLKRTQNAHCMNRQVVCSVTNEGKPLACIVATKRACSLFLTLYHVVVTWNFELARRFYCSQQ